MRCSTSSSSAASSTGTVGGSTSTAGAAGSSATGAAAAGSSAAAQLRFDVIDHGEGISLEQQPIIFDAYERASSTAGGGTGLGLTLCRKLALLLGGGIEVESKLGEGARFTVHIDRHLAP